MKSIEINHGGKVHAVTSIFLESPLYVILHWAESKTSTATGSPSPTGVSNEYRIVQVDTVTGQVRHQSVASKHQFGVTLSEQMESSHQVGLPPMTFFSQISPNE